MVNIVGTDARLLTKTTTLGLVIYYTRLVALRKHGNVTISSKAKSHGSWSTEDTDGYPKIMRHPKTSGQISEPLAKFSCTTLKSLG